MSCNSKDLEAVMARYSGGSEERFRHALNRRFSYSAGMRDVAETAGAWWLIDDVALLLAPVYAKAWQQGRAGIGIVKLHVEESSPGRRSATLSLSLEDDKPDEAVQRIAVTDFPPGKWHFYLGTDSVSDDENDTVTTLIVPAEY